MNRDSDYGIAQNPDTWPFMTKGNGVSNAHPNGNLPNNVTVGARTFVYRAPTYVYVPIAGDTLASVARKLFGANTKHHRDFLRRQGFAEGRIVTYNGDNNPYANFSAGAGDGSVTGNAGQDTMGDNNNDGR